MKYCLPGLNLIGAGQLTTNPQQTPNTKSLVNFSYMVVKQQIASLQQSTCFTLGENWLLQLGETVPVLQYTPLFPSLFSVHKFNEYFPFHANGPSSEFLQPTLFLNAFSELLEQWKVSSLASNSSVNPFNHKEEVYHEDGGITKFSLGPLNENLLGS